MGHELASRAFLWSSLLTPRESLTLVCMALHAHDQDEHPIYFAGSHKLALMTLGRILTPESPTYLSDKETVRRAIAGLVKAGAISRVRQATNAARANYELHLDRLPLPGIDPRDRRPVDNVVDIRHRLIHQTQRNVGPETQRNVGPETQRNVGPETQRNVGPIGRGTREEDR